MRLMGDEANLTELVKASEHHKEEHHREKPNRNTVKCYLAELVRDGVIESEKRGRERVWLCVMFRMLSYKRKRGSRKREEKIQSAKIILYLLTVHAVIFN